MAQPATSISGDLTSVEGLLREELARGDRSLRGVAPVLAHMLASPGNAMVTDAIVARVRGMLEHLARQLLAAERAERMGDAARGSADPPEDVDALAAWLASDHVVLGHSYVLAMESHLAERLERRASVDPVLSPLLQELIASEKPATAELAMATLAAQSRFIQSQRRMDMPLAELPAELFLSVIECWQNAASESNGEDVPRGAVDRLKRSYDEGASRGGLLARLVSAMGNGAVAALELEHAGLALFATALASRTRQPRDNAVIACHESQAARLALAFRAAGMDAAAIERQFLVLEPGISVPEVIGKLAPDRAQAILAQSEARVMDIER
ncbi:hypothetical protein Ga0102493_112436 [Erythrobacter litoralis]|uniref:DUF2336 domain-containing protein n=1 Tax=Erythrobacter litoralis TaxID=39960 RepID=A0A074MC74_9SPHN|nr:hypothetical protein [Erythrobacter litoralis]AOL23451.1 hypothetical protein Ga0102493_112436 [Erythrobacter litoralis]KEO92406.1 hypothetical protein EH32_14190 [Erythrobacter litoralis]